MKTLITLTYLSLLFIANNSFADYSLAKTGNQRFLLLNKQGESVVTIEGIAFGPGWQWASVKPIDTKDYNEHINYQYTINNGDIKWDLALRNNPQDSSFSFNSQLQASTFTPLTYIAFSLTPGEVLNGGQLIATTDKKQTFVLPVPLKIKQLSHINQLILKDKQGNTSVKFHFEQPIDIHIDKTARLKLADRQIVDNQTLTHKISLLTTSPITYYKNTGEIPNDTNHTHWFAFKPKNTSKAGALGMQDWLAIPQKPLLLKNHQILNGKIPYKAWGTNVEYTHNAPPKRDATQRAKFFAKYGINSVRLHKLTNPSWEGLGSDQSASKYDREKLSRFDFWTSRLRKQGITYGFSPIWDLKVLPGDKERLIAYDEIVQASPNKPVTTGLVWFAPDIQDLHIETLVNLLKHKNRYTGLVYAKDPALAYVELQNEENSFFYSFISKVRRYPTYHKMLAEQFSDWLQQKYGSEEELIKQWGIRAINTFSREGGLPDEQLSKRNITPVISPWFYDNQATRGSRAKRLQDSAEFLFEKQQQYYHKASRTLREIGYKGPIVASNWQAGSKGAHFLNLLSDANVGIVDRHNYQGGAIGRPAHLMNTGFGLHNYTMLGAPGSGLLSMGMQQVAGRPFMSSEWLAVLPSEWAAADTTIIAAYGFGLQGWDMSYHFASNGNGFSSALGAGDGKAKFNNLTPVGLGLYPVLSRMVLRGDVSEAKPLAIRRLSKQQAITNTYDFNNTINQQHDIKYITGTPHHNALAAGKVLIEFTQQDATSSIVPWQQHYQIDLPNNTSTIKSSTGELSWTFNRDQQKGFITINTSGTQGVAGFHHNKAQSFKDLSITPHTPYAVILATAKAPTKHLNNDDEAIIVAIARAHNTEMNLKNTIIANLGTAPTILEPVKATLQFKRKKGTVVVLNHDGIATGKTYPLQDGIFQLDTQKDKTIYYLVKFD